MAKPQTSIQRGPLSLITLGHFWLDSYANILPALLPLVILKLDLSLTLAGILASVFSLSSSLTQTVIGYFSDRMRVRSFVVLGPLFAAVFVCSIGLVPDYSWLIVVLILGGLGVSAFHPQTVSMAGDISGIRRGLGVSLFVAGGTAGYALAPFWITVLVSAYSMDVLPYVAIPGVLTALLILWLVPLTNEAHDRKQSLTMRQAFHGRLRPIFMLTSTVVARSVTRLGMMAFLPIMLTAKGGSLVAGGSALTVFSFLGAIGSLVGGAISDRIGRRWLIFLSMALSSPLLYFSLYVEGMPFFILLGLGGFMLFIADAVVVATAQELVPDRSAMASSLVMGLGWGLGGLAVSLVGGISDAIGIPATLSGVALLPILCFGFCFGIPEPDKEADFPDADTGYSNDGAAVREPAGVKNTEKIAKN